jgi:acyl carrier protein
MDATHFTNNLANVFEDTDPVLLNHDCIFKDLDEWNSLVALSVIAMIDEEYGVAVKGDDIRNASTINDLCELVKSKL